MTPEQLSPVSVKREFLPHTISHHGDGKDQLSAGLKPVANQQILFMQSLDKNENSKDSFGNDSDFACIDLDNVAIPHHEEPLRRGMLLRCINCHIEFTDFLCR
jgi:hypothetical protein